MSDTRTKLRPSSQTVALREGDISYVSLWVPNVARAAAFYGAVLGWRLAVERVRSAGGQATPPTRQPFGELANCVDDQGMPFSIFTPSPSAPLPRAESRPGDLSYIALHVPDADRARAFYGAVLGWRFAPGHSGGWNVTTARPTCGLSGGTPRRWRCPCTRWPTSTPRSRAFALYMVTPATRFGSRMAARASAPTTKARTSTWASSNCLGGASPAACGTLAGHDPTGDAAG